MHVIDKIRFLLTGRPVGHYRCARCGLRVAFTGPAAAVKAVAEQVTGHRCPRSLP